MPWTPKTQQAETWTAIVQETRAFDPNGFDRTPRFDTGTSAGLWDSVNSQAEVWTPA